MKKIITLVLAVAFVATANAQTSKEEARRIILGQPKTSPKNTPNQESRDVILGGGNNGGNYPNSYPRNYPSGSRESQIAQVNREYNAKIQSIRNNRYLSQEEKARAIRQLENDRARRIREINSRYGNRDDRDDDYKYKKHNKGNNGKHLGWEKGKGNPHKNGGRPGGKKG